MTAKWPKLLATLPKIQTEAHPPSAPGSKLAPIQFISCHKYWKALAEVRHSFWSLFEVTG